MKTLSAAVIFSALVFPFTAAHAGGWVYGSSDDKMRGSTESYAQLKSEDVISLDFPYRGGSSLSVLLRDSQRYGGLNVLLKLSKGQLLCAYGGCRIAAKFDNGKIATFRASKASGGNSDTIFIDDAKGFLKRLRSSDQVIIEVPVWKHGDAQFTFSPKGLTWK